MAATKTPSTSRGGSRWSRALRTFRTHLGDFANKVLINTGAVGGAALLLGAHQLPLQVLGLVAALASLVAIVWRRRQAFRQPVGNGLLGFFGSARAFLLFAVGAGYVLRRPDDRGWIWAAVAVGAVLVLCEPLVRSMLVTVKQVVLNLPGVRTVPEPPFAPSWLAVVAVVEIAVGAVLAALAAPGWIYLLLMLASAPLMAVTVRHAVQATVISKRAEAGIGKALERLQPAFVVYYAALHGARYQLGMWLPYLERLHKPFIVIARNPEAVPVIATLTSAPILVPKLNRVSESLDSMVVPSLQAAFYVQGSPQNQTMQRYRRLTHVWLNHGDSDKEASFHPRHATYDKLFVAGQQGIERYAQHGIEVQPERFVIVGRPQVETIETRETPLPAGTPRTVLYAPTWKGGRPSTNYSSLPFGDAIVRALLERGCTVVFRPHPVSYEDRQDERRIRHIQSLLEADRTASAAAGTPREHVWGKQAEKVWDVPACFNASDALITDVSSIATDYLASGKPFAMTAVTVGGDRFVREFPTAQAAYVIEKDLSTLVPALDALLGEDRLREVRLSYRDFVLGPQVGPRAADTFLRIAGEIVDGKRT